MDQKELILGEFSQELQMYMLINHMSLVIGGLVHPPPPLGARLHDSKGGRCHLEYQLIASSAQQSLGSISTGQSFDGWPVWHPGRS